MHNRIRFMMLSGWMFVTACDATPDTLVGENIASHSNALENENALNLNALNLNALDSTSLNAIQAPGPSGDMARQLVQYAVSCALDSTQSFSFTWRDTGGVTHQENDPGLLGLATDWASQPLSASGEQWVSACLAARVNWYGVHVMLSARGSNTGLQVSDPERSTFMLQEGAFFGNLFGPTPKVYSCDNDAHVDLARSRYRDCAAGHLNLDTSVSDCGIIQRLGSCSSRCAAADPTDGYYPSCRDPGETPIAETITIYLE